MPVDLLADYYKWTVSTGGTTAPTAGTSETWTVASSAGAPAATTGISQFRVVDLADTNTPPEIMIVTNVSGTTWSATRGGEGGAPWAHAPGWIAVPVLTAGGIVNLPPLTITTPAAGSVPLTINGAASQGGDLLDINNSIGTRLVNVDYAGNLFVRGGGLTITQPSAYGCALTTNGTGAYTDAIYCYNASSQMIFHVDYLGTVTASSNFVTNESVVIKTAGSWTDALQITPLSSGGFNSNFINVQDINAVPRFVLNNYACLAISPSWGGAVPLTINLPAGQAVDCFDIKNNSGAAILSVSANGQLSINSLSNTPPLFIKPGGVPAYHVQVQDYQGNVLMNLDQYGRLFIAPTSGGGVGSLNGIAGNQLHGLLLTAPSGVSSANMITVQATYGGTTYTMFTVDGFGNAALLGSGGNGGGTLTLSPPGIRSVGLTINAPSGQQYDCFDINIGGTKTLYVDSLGDLTIAPLSYSSVYIPLTVQGNSAGSDIVQLKNSGGITLVAVNSGGALSLLQTAAATVVYQSQITTDSNPRLTISAGGILSWGPGGLTAPDTTLARNGVGALSVTTTLYLGSASGQGGQLYFTRDGGVNWNFNQLTGDSTLYIRDVPNARIHITLTPGASVAAATTAINSSLTVAGSTTSSGAVSVGSTPSFGSGTGPMLFVANDTADPTVAPTGGALLYSSAGVLKARTPDGSVTQLAPIATPFFTTSFLSGGNLTIASGATTAVTAWGTTNQVQRGLGSWASGSYTVGLAGLYRVRFSLTWGLGTAFTTDAVFGELIYKGGAEVARHTFYVVTLTTGAVVIDAVERTILCAVNDVISFYAFNGSSVSESVTAANAGNFIEITYIEP